MNRIRICIECNHFKPAADCYDFIIPEGCTAPYGKVDYVRGGYYIKKPEFERMSGDCGKDGKYFQVKPPRVSLMEKINKWLSYKKWILKNIVKNF